MWVIEGAYREADGCRKMQAVVTSSPLSLMCRCCAASTRPSGQRTTFAWLGSRPAGRAGAAFVVLAAQI